MRRREEGGREGQGEGMGEMGGGRRHKIGEGRGETGERDGEETYSKRIIPGTISASIVAT